MPRTNVFISYAHEDDRWRERVVEQLNVLAREGLLNVWDDRNLSAGDEWLARLHENMLSARIAVLLISPAFLTSDFILNHEVPKLFERHQTDGMRIYPLLVRPCPWQEVSWVARMQLRPLEARAVSSYRGASRDQVLADVAREIATLART